MAKGFSLFTIAAGFCALGTIMGAAHAADAADTWPQRPMNWVVGYAAGGTTDIVARIVAKKVSEELGQTIVVTNKPGANSNIGAVLVKREKPDGYSFYVGSAANTINVTLYKDPGYHIATDFAAVSLFGTVPNILVVNPELPIKTVKEYIAHAKANPGKLSCASSGAGSTTHMSCEMFKIQTGTNILHVPYTGSGPAMAALLGGQVDSMFDNLPTVKPNVDAGKLRALGVTSAKRDPSSPDIPTLNEAGVPGFDVSAWFGLFAPAGTDPAIVAKANKAVNQALNDSAIRNLLTSRGLTIPAGANTPNDFAERVRSDVDKWGKVVKASGAKVE